MDPAVASRAQATRKACCCNTPRRRLLTRLLLSALLLANSAPAAAQPEWERRIWFHPTRGKTPAPAGWQAIDVPTSDGLHLNAWWRNPPQGAPTLLSFHGNGGNIEFLTIRETVEEMHWGGLLLDYRGYGESGGEPSEEGLFLDAQAAYEACRRRGVGVRRLLIHGQSLGGAVAVHLAALQPCAGLILESTFSSARDMAVHLRGSAAAALIQTRFDSLAAARKLKCPTLVIHGDQDSLIPWQLGRRLFQAVAARRSWWLVTGADHNNLRRTAGDAFAQHFRAFARSLSAGPAPARSTPGSGRKRDG